MPQANRARRRCEIRHYAPVACGRTSPSGCQGATLVTAGVIPAPVGPDPAQPCLPSRVHLQVRGGIAGPRVGFQAPAANKTLCRGTFALSALGEVWGPCGAAWGAQRAGGARSFGPNPAPRCAPPPGQADLPLPPQPRPSLSCQVRPLHPESLLIFKGRDPSLCREHVAPSPATCPWTMKSKDVPGSGDHCFFQAPAHSSRRSLHSDLPCCEGSPTLCHLQTAKPCPLAKYRVF